MNLLISVDKLTSILENLSKNGNIKDKDILIIDTRRLTDYTAGHIPTAINFDVTQHALEHTWESDSKFYDETIHLMTKLGITEDKFVIFYDDYSGPLAPRGVWLLLYVSHSKVAMLDGGYNEWIKDGRNVETKMNLPEPVSMSSNEKLNTDVVATINDILPLIGLESNALTNSKDIDRHKVNQNAVILDTRSIEEYEGTASFLDSRKGHIPTAIHIDWENNIIENKFKELYELYEIYNKIPKEKEIVLYCHGGYRAANTFVVLKILGYEKVKLYSGSWQEWSKIETLPVELATPMPQSCA